MNFTKELHKINTPKEGNKSSEKTLTRRERRKLKKRKGATSKKPVTDAKMLNLAQVQAIYRLRQAKSATETGDSKKG